MGATIIYLILNLFHIIYCEWIQIAQTSNDRKTNFDLDRSQFLASLNIKKDLIVNVDVSNSNVDMIEDLNKNQYNSDGINSNNHLSNISKINWKDSAKMLISDSTIHGMNKWPIRNKIEENVDVYTENSKDEQYFATKTVTVNPLKNVSDLSIIATNMNGINNNIVSNHSIRESAKKKPKLKFDFQRMEYKPFDFGSVFNFLKKMQKNFLLESLPAIDDKIKFLEKFKGNIMSNIGM